MSGAVRTATDIKAAAGRRLQAREPAAARALLGPLCERCPADAEAWQLLASACSMLGEPAAAESHARRALALDPGLANAHALLGELGARAGDIPSACAHYRQALRLRPDAAVIHYNFATLLQAQGDHEDAAEHYARALERRPALVVAWNNLGLVRQAQGRVAAAMESFTRGIECCQADPAQARGVAELHWHRALLRLLSGDFVNGWPEYEWRRADPHADRRPFIRPRWDGGSLAGRSILVSAEQGVGDEIMFASCLPDLAARAAGVVLECEPRLAPLFARSFPGITVIPCPRSETLQLPAGLAVDCQVAAGSLPLYLRGGADTFPAHDGYLLPDPEAVAKWRARYAAIGDGLRVGISWRGGSAARREKRSTTLEQWQGLAGVPGVVFVNLQYGDCGGDLAAARQAGLAIHDWEEADPLRDLDDFAAQVAALDLVISVDNATVHLAGALGVPVWVLQPFMPEWRWLLGCEGSYWYPSVRQFRQPRAGQWAAVFEDVARVLSALVAAS